MVPARACALCVVGGGVKAPRGMPVGVVSVAEDWLLKLAETYELPNPKHYTVELS